MYTMIDLPAKVRKHTQQTSTRVMCNKTQESRQGQKAGKHDGNVVSGRVQIGISLYDVTVQKQARI